MIVDRLDQGCGPGEETSREGHKPLNHLGRRKRKLKLFHQPSREVIDIASSGLKLSHRGAPQPAGPEVLAGTGLEAEQLVERTELDKNPAHIE